MNNNVKSVFLLSVILVMIIHGCHDGRMVEIALREGDPRNKKRKFKMNQNVTVNIPKSLYNLLEERIEGTGFPSVTDFIIHVMKDIVASGKLTEDMSLKKNEIDEIRKRLKHLGYI